MFFWLDVPVKKTIKGQYMAEEPNATPVAEPTTPPAGNDPKPTDKGGADFDPSSISDENFAKLFDDPRLFQHSRFKQLNEQAKKAREYEELQKKTQEEQMKKKGEYEELLSQKEKTIAELNDRFSNTVLNNAIMTEASKKGIKDLDAATKLIDRSNLKVNDDGTVEGISEAIDALSKERSYLLQVNRSRIGDPTNPSNSENTKRFKMSQLQDTKFYQEHRDEIREALAKGEVEEDRF